MLIPTAEVIDEIPEYEEGGSFTITVGDEVFEVPSHCPHRQGWLAHGMVNERRKTITCPLHFSTFSLEDGRQISGPKCGPLMLEK